ncbi:MAG: Xaa-Pro peptidase family protein [Pleurocapsa minor GSE-CHR-MK-17-07R]|jgi:Xaa-Pro aminopeptidase|nr:Xaa-Pro peptidase family protein [Pleurocapsa minor GSE-CHR-MK 17-07R]
MALFAGRTVPQIPHHAYPQRWAAVQRLMREAGLDLLIAYADDRQTYGPAHARWLADFPVMFEPVCILFRQTGAPIMVCGPESDEFARVRGRIADVRVLQEFTHPDEDYPFAVIQSLGDILRESYGEIADIQRVGVAGKSLMNADLFAALQATLPGADWRDVDQQVCMLRAVKSPDEVAIIRYAYQIAQAGMTAAIEAVGPGVTEREVAAAADIAMRSMGAESAAFDTMVVSGPSTRPIMGRSTFRVIQPGDLVVVTLAPRFEGYHAAIGRPMFIGHQDPEVRRAFEVARDAQLACAQALRPGIEGRSIDQLGRKLVGEAGLGEYYLYTGLHSVGVIEFEPPIFSSHNPTVLEPGMIVSIDIPLFNAPWGGLRVEDGFLITEQGAERLHDTPYLIEK